jgi:hypothetical protein
MVASCVAGQHWRRNLFCHSECHSQTSSRVGAYCLSYFGGKNKEQLQDTEFGDSFLQCLERRQPQEGVMERRRVICGTTEKFKQQRAQLTG